MVNLASLLWLLPMVKVGTFIHSMGLSPHMDILTRRKGLYEARRAQSGCLSKAGGGQDGLHRLELSELLWVSFG